MAVSGSIQKATIDSVTYYVKADSDPTHAGDYATEGIRHSGGTLMKKELQVANIESLDLIVDSVDEQNLRDVAAGSDNVPLSLTYADGTVKTAEGQINIENRTAQENTMPITMIPDGEWQIFAP
jgi:hypothetical protein